MEMNNNNNPLKNNSTHDFTENNYTDTYPKYFWELFGSGNNLGFDEEPDDPIIKSDDSFPDL